MSPALLLAIIQSLPAAMALVQSMISDFQSGNSLFTEQDIINIQAQVQQNSQIANNALLEIMQLKSNAAATSGTTAA